MDDLKGKVAIVTGAGGRRGIGKAISIRLAQKGVKVVVSDVVEIPYLDGDWKGVNSVVEEIKISGGEAISKVADVRNSRSVESLIGFTIENFGNVDILVNNAGAIAGKDRVPVVDLKEEDWDLIQTVNLKGVFLCSKAVARRLIFQGNGGRIINMSSVAGKRGAENFSAYCSAKAGVISFTESLALELAHHKITVNAVCPGWIDTERVDHFSSTFIKGNYSNLEKRQIHISNVQDSVPLGRIGQVEEVAGLVSYLASGDADYITGSSINVSGGRAG